MLCKTPEYGNIEKTMKRWTFLTNYGHVLLCIAADPSIRLIDIASQVGITERTAQRIVADLIDEGYLKHSKVGRRNQYQIRPDLPMRHPAERENDVGALLKLLSRKPAIAGGDGFQSRTQASGTTSGTEANEAS